ncbi:uncharacterized protein N7483_007668 [Penicillium malachiteum]|uniref:uncharacterized protein n=1 Tax=Penicillium malachiteum TaxID=1324776 RepID=UPI002547C28D|nr:uncharacterized protein N7483_007668 [Penicillium malachiteum]KAJ5726311.1 hypothetical protein N7483_007668 [Penicillium malachiteum]
MPPTYLSGACLCKNITYRVVLHTPESYPDLIICHCTNCKRYTGAGFSTNIIVPSSDFQYTKGLPKLYLDIGNKEGQVLREFCPDCGTPFTSQSKSDMQMVAVKSGTLDDEHRIKCTKLAAEIYHHRKDGWVTSIGTEDVQKINGSMG